MFVCILNSSTFALINFFLLLQCVQVQLNFLLSLKVLDSLQTKKQDKTFLFTRQALTRKNFAKVTEYLTKKKKDEKVKLQLKLLY